jgi:hypothetical protein
LKASEDESIWVLIAVAVFAAALTGYVIGNFPK